MVDKAIEMLLVNAVTVVDEGISHATASYRGEVHAKIHLARPMRKNRSRVLIIVPFIVLQHEMTLERRNLTMDQR